MKKIEVVIEGQSPLLMHSAEGMVMQKAKKNPAKQYDPKIDAEKVAYRNKKKELYVPSRCLKACFVNGASWYKFGSKSAKPIVAGCTQISETEVPLLDSKDKVIKKYEIDLRPVVVQRASIIRARPRFDEWKLKFTIVYNDAIISDTDILKKIFEESGQRIGLLDFRPQKYGDCGTFKVTKWKEI